MDWAVFRPEQLFRSESSSWPKLGRMIVMAEVSTRDLLL